MKLFKTCSVDIWCKYISYRLQETVKAGVPAEQQSMPRAGQQAHLLLLVHLYPEAHLHLRLDCPEPIYDSSSCLTKSCCEIQSILESRGVKARREVIHLNLMQPNSFRSLFHSPASFSCPHLKLDRSPPFSDILPLIPFSLQEVLSTRRNKNREEKPETPAEPEACDSGEPSLPNHLEPSRPQACHTKLCEAHWGGEGGGDGWEQSIIKLQTSIAGFFE